LMSQFDGLKSSRTRVSVRARFVVIDLLIKRLGAPLEGRIGKRV